MSHSAAATPPGSPQKSMGSRMGGAVGGVLGGAASSVVSGAAGGLKSAGLWALGRNQYKTRQTGRITSSEPAIR